MHDGDDSRIGTLITNADRKAEWRDFVLALHEAAAPGGALEGWLFHGTSSARAKKIARQGVTTTAALAQDAEGGEWTWTDGTHWGHPKVAAFYAEDLIESTGRTSLQLAIVACRIDDLGACGPFATDGQTIDCPLYTRLGRKGVETDALWDASDKGWRACLDVLGTLLVLGPVGPDEIRILRSSADLERLCLETGPAPRP